jgi:HSP20 family molecular chaperone IbpA
MRDMLDRVALTRPREPAFRSVHLPTSIDPSSMKAEYRNGMLRLRAAVAQAEAPRQVDREVA